MDKWSKSKAAVIEVDLIQGVCPSCNHLPCICGSRSLEADEGAGYPPNCKKGYEAKDGKCVPISENEAKKKENPFKKKGDDEKKDGDEKKENPFKKKDKDKKKGNAKEYPGKNVKRRKDGVPQKKTKKRACEKGEHRDKSGKLVKNSKGDYSNLWKLVNEK